MCFQFLFCWQEDTVILVAVNIGGYVRRKPGLVVCEQQLCRQACQSPSAYSDQHAIGCSLSVASLIRFEPVSVAELILAVNPEEVFL